MKNKKMIVGALLLLAVVLILIVFFILNTKGKMYEVVSAKKGSITEAIYGLGTVRSNSTFSFKVGVPKTLQTLSVKEGDEVSKGQLLFSFNDGMSVRSPIQGSVVDLSYNAGENVFTDKPIITIEDLHDLYIEARIDQQGTLRVKPGLAVRLSFESLRSETFKGTVRSLYPNQGEFVARIETQKMPASILPGMTADVAIEVDAKESALLIPVRAISSGAVLRERNGERSRVSVTIGVSDDEWAEVLSGDIQAGDGILIKK